MIKWRDEMSSPNQTRSQRLLPNPRIALPQQLNILRAYAAVSGPDRRAVSNDEVAGIVKLSKKTVPLANPFLHDVGLIEKANGKYVPVSAVFEFAQVHGWGGEHEERAPHELAPVVSETWFAKALLPKLAFGRVLTSEALRDLAKEAGVPPDNRQLRLLLDFLELTGLIRIEGDHVHSGKAPRGTKDAPELPPPPPSLGYDHLPLLIRGLIDKLPAEKEGWTPEEAKRWLDLAEVTFPMAYDYEGTSPKPQPTTSMERET
jgi:hypothetical protein